MATYSSTVLDDEQLAGGVPHIDPRLLVDRFGRRISYLRLSITDRCDFRCLYCMAEDMRFLPRHEVLKLEEARAVAAAFVDLGVTKVRITGGEPLVRRNAVWLMGEIARLPGLKELVLTTNGSQLERYATGLKAAGVKRINVSLDTLDPSRFKAITRCGDIARVMRGIEAARAAGFSRLKLNVVMMRGCNDSELPDLVDFAIDKDLDISFIEEMPLGEVGYGRGSSYFSSDEALAILRKRFTLLPTGETSGGPARYWRLPGSPTRVGFISPHSHNFCDSCNRVRITARGELCPCLGQDHSISLLPVMRDHPGDHRGLKGTIVEAMGLKPQGHDFARQVGAPQIVRFMSMTGG